MSKAKKRLEDKFLFFFLFGDDEDKLPGTSQIEGEEEQVKEK